MQNVNMQQIATVKQINAVCVFVRNYMHTALQAVFNEEEINGSAFMYAAQECLDAISMLCADCGANTTLQMCADAVASIDDDCCLDLWQDAYGADVAQTLVTQFA